MAAMTREARITNHLNGCFGANRLSLPGRLLPIVDRQKPDNNCL